ncbi:hypothetical protein Tco_0786052, partial [Tanacetum coccineum]
MPNAACLSVMSSPGPRRFWQKVVPPPIGPKFYPKTGYRVKRTARKCVVPIEFHPSRLKRKLLERISKDDSEEDPKEDSEEEGEPKKKRLKEASKSNSNTLPSDYTTPNEEIETDLDSTARCEAKPKELENTCESSVQFKPDSPQTIPAYMLPDYPS